MATLCGARGQRAIADRGRNHGQPWLRHLGFTRDRAPSQPTLSRLFARIAHDGGGGGAAVGGAGAAAVPPAGGEREGVARDGKTLRGSKRQGAADALPLALLLEGRVVTADALPTRRAIARTILASGGDYLLVVKENQPTRHADIAASFAPEADDTGPVGAACTVTQHGGRNAQRRLTASTALVGDGDWPGLRQALRLARRVLDKRTGGLLRQEAAYAVTSLRPQRAAPAPLRAPWRRHWAIENQPHHARDVAFDEDRATARAGHAPQVMAACRNTASGLIHALGTTQIAATCRQSMARPPRSSRSACSTTLHRPCRSAGRRRRGVP